MIFFYLKQIPRRLQRSGIIFIGVTSFLTTPASSETGVKMTTSYLEGEVIAVDNNLVLELKITKKVNFDYEPADRIKIFRLDTTPDALRWLTLGRNVTCGWMYSEEHYLVAHCSTEDIANDNKFLQHSWTPLERLVEKLGLGKSRECTTEDIEGINKFYPEGWLRTYC